MKQFNIPFVMLCLILIAGISVLLKSQTQSRSLDVVYQGKYTAYTWSKDRGLTWSHSFNAVGIFKKHIVCMQSMITWYDPDLEYNSIIITKFNGIICVYIRVTQEDTIIISPLVDEEKYMVQIIHNDRELARYLCTKN